MTSASHAVPLDRIPIGVPARVETVGSVGSLADVGVVVGTDVIVERVLPLGGPVIVRLGTARVALGRSVAHAILATPEAGR